MTARTGTCGTCKHWMPQHEIYPACALRNRKPGWAELEFMPADEDDSCPQHEGAET